MEIILDYEINIYRLFINSFIRTINISACYCISFKITIFLVIFLKQKHSQIFSLHAILAF